MPEKDAVSLANLIVSMPCWYWTALVILSLFYAYRAIIEINVRIKNKLEPEMTITERIIVRDIQEILFKIFFTASGFISLFVANHIFYSLKSFNEIGVGTAILLIFLLIWGVSGVSGYLTYLIIKGIFPGFKGSQ
jgi:hypothetical protein